MSSTASSSGQLSREASSPGAASRGASLSGGAGPGGPPAIPTTLLTGPVEAAYVKRLVEVLRLARLNTHYPDVRRLRSHVEAMSPALHTGLYPGLEIDLRSGLPTYREWTRVQTDVQLAGQLLDDLGPVAELERRSGAGTDPIYQRQLAKHHYYKALVGRPTATLGSMSVQLRRVDPASQTAWFNVVLDKLDASGLFVRFTVDLSQRATVWNRPLVRLDADTAQHTEELQSLIYRFTSLDAEFTYFKLVTFGHLQVERVVKGTVGPVVFPGRPATDALSALLEGRDEGFIACFPLDMVATDLAADRDNDPLDDLLSARLSEEARPDYERARAEHGYHVFKDCKFVTSPSLSASLEEFCGRMGTKNIIHAVRGEGC